jgi:hypothetical protein
MAKYIVSITEKLVKTVIIEAENKEEARDKVETLWDHEEIILYPTDFSEADFETLREANNEDFANWKEVPYED